MRLSPPIDFKLSISLSRSISLSPIYLLPTYLSTRLSISISLSLFMFSIYFLNLRISCIFSFYLCSYLSRIFSPSTYLCLYLSIFLLSSDRPTDRATDLPPIYLSVLQSVYLSTYHSRALHLLRNLFLTLRKCRACHEILRKRLPRNCAFDLAVKRCACHEICT